MARAAVQEPLWRTLLSASEPMSVPELRDVIRASPSAIKLRLTRWEQAGLVARADGPAVRYVITEDGRSAANDDHRAPPTVRADGSVLPRNRSQRARLWSAIRVLKRFSLPELKMSAGASRRSTEDLINCLQRAGYLRLVERGNSMAGTWSVYQLAANTGPKTPIITHNGGRRRLVDPNNGKVIDISPSAVSLRRSQPAADAGGEG